MNGKFINQLVVFRPYFLDSAIIVWLSPEGVYQLLRAPCSTQSRSASISP